MITDPIADLLTRIRNATMARKDSVTVGKSKVKLGVLEVLQKKGFISSYEVTKNEAFEEIVITLNPEKGRFNLKRISKPGQRIYIANTSLKKVNGGLGVAVLSTSKGIMSGEEATKLKIGGELICEVY